MPLVHKSIDIRPEVWKQLRIHAELSNVPVRDFLTYLIDRSQPIGPDNPDELAVLAEIVRLNREARTGEASSNEATVEPSIDAVDEESAGNAEQYGTDEEATVQNTE